MMLGPPDRLLPRGTEAVTGNTSGCWSLGSLDCSIFSEVCPNPHTTSGEEKAWGYGHGSQREQGQLAGAQITTAPGWANTGAVISNLLATGLGTRGPEAHRKRIVRKVGSSHDQ
jgi:hypothetical protein